MLAPQTHQLSVHSASPPRPFSVSFLHSATVPSLLRACRNACGDGWNFLCSRLRESRMHVLSATQKESALAKIIHLPGEMPKTLAPSKKSLITGRGKLSPRT